ncbi:hypothetical protein Q31b_50940 [Novipirellula aureliae]|uniref:Uncharacterized protein n=1 Tax=Novipirellula aureliae TaxID=2527966 RepID=A0A5C6DL77_9BACT|nr:hypothetical protein [Novipirellula aureliae]TWU35659.1 hypothetical protein Q31b_50940 [Novipirellula aureliae]
MIDFFKKTFCSRELVNIARGSTVSQNSHATPVGRNSLITANHLFDALSIASMGPPIDPLDDSVDADAIDVTFSVIPGSDVDESLPIIFI